MLRLDPVSPPLWRSPDVLQFGLDAVAVLHDPAPWELRLIHALEGGIPDSALGQVADALGAPEGGAATLLRRLGAAVRVEGAVPPLRVALQLPYPVDHPLGETLASALESSGLVVARCAWHGAPDEPVGAEDPVVIVAHGVVEPRRVAALMAADAPHLPIVFSGEAAEVGPAVVPGHTACLACVAAHRRDADPSWPLLAAQLLGRTAPPVDRALAFEAGALAARLVSEVAHHPERASRDSIVLRAGRLHRATRTHRPHAECRCRSLSGTATADGRGVPAPTRSTTLAVPA